jgi:4-hydroxy-3-methylbut-2-enyl diphosphate reductase
MPTYFISGEEKILSAGEILHYNFHAKKEEKTANWLPAPVTATPVGSVPVPAPTAQPTAPASPAAAPTRILISSGASCPDALVEAVIRKLAGYYGATKALDALTPS